MFKGILVGIVLCLVGLALGVYIYVATGRAPAAVSDSPFPFERKFAHMALNAHIARQRAPGSPVGADEQDYLAGAADYKQQCPVGHGLPDQHKPANEEGMYPPP